MFTGVLQMAAQMKQLEQKLMALREDLREREAKARQAEGSVQDLKLQLEDLQVCQSAPWGSQCTMNVELACNCVSVPLVSFGFLASFVERQFCT